MLYLKNFSKQIEDVTNHPTATRSSKLLMPMHSAIADQVESHGFTTRSLRNKEYKFEGPYGTKDLDVAIFKDNKLVGAIMFKGIRSEYNKNSNNYFENMRGESQLLLDGGIPVYQIILIPTKVKHKDSKGIITFESPSDASYNNYVHYINDGYKPEKLKLGVYYIDVDYDKFTANYSTKVVPGVETTMTEGIDNFMKLLE